MKGRSLKIVVAALFIVGLMVSSSFAAPMTAKVIRTSSGDAGVVSLRLEYVSGDTACDWSPDRWFDIDASVSGMDDQALAVALTAISLGINVRVGVNLCPDNVVSGNPTFNWIGLENTN